MRDLQKLIVGKPLQTVYEMLPIGNYTKIMVDEIGIYQARYHKEQFGKKYVQSYGEWDENVLYVSTYVRP